MIQINLSGAFINHKIFGKGQIIEQGADFVTVLFSEKEQKKKFIYPTAIGSFLVLEDPGIAKQYKEYSAAMANDIAKEQKAAEERLASEKTIQEHEKTQKKARKKPAKSN